MLRLIGIMITIGLADSLNPSTVAPALYIASGPRPIRTLLEFIGGVFVTYLTGGIIIALGPGQLLLGLVPHPDELARQIIEVIAGAVLIGGGLVVWQMRSVLEQRQLPGSSSERRRSAAWLGATIMLVELPTAFPYFGAIAAVVGSGKNIGSQVILLVLFNVCFVLPLLAIVAVLWLYGDRAGDVLTRVRTFLSRHWPALLAGALVIGGAIVITLGITGIASRSRGPLGRFARRLRRLIR